MVKARDTSAHQASGCVTRGKQTRCAVHVGTEPEAADFKAISAIKEAALEGLKIP